MLFSFTVRFVFFILIAHIASCQNTNTTTMEYNKLTPEEERIILHKGTERAFTGIYNDHKEHGIYLCKRCNVPLFKSDDKFSSGCGWPSFDDQIPGAVSMLPDADGHRTEIICTNCGGHLGHVFYGEGFTKKDARYCVNSVSLNFKTEEKPNNHKVYFAAGCFWGVEYFFQKEKGVISATSGYMGGKTNNPTYEQVCAGRSGHAETVEVEYDPSLTDFEKLVRLFFEIHDFTQINRQGPDVGTQYRSAIFYNNQEQKFIAEKYVKILQDKGYNVATTIEPATTFWPAEGYHQEYYFKKGGIPYCHVKREVF